MAPSISVGGSRNKLRRLSTVGSAILENNEQRPRKAASGFCYGTGF